VAILASLCWRQAGLLPVHGPKLFQHTLQSPTDTGQIDHRLASLVAQGGISFPNYTRYRDRWANCERLCLMNKPGLVQKVWN
jgi:hypothetical protein